jgi:hypothetical protein
MSGGLLARLRFWSPPRREDEDLAAKAPAEGIEAPAPPVAEEPPRRADAPAECVEVPEPAVRVELSPNGPAGTAADASPAADALEQDGATAQPAEEPDVPLRSSSLRSVPARPLPSFRPAPAAPASSLDVEPEAASPLSLTLSEAIEIVHESGGDAMELRFLRRELQRRRREGSEPPELWARVEQAAAGRLRRVGRLVEGQALALQRDPGPSA